MIKELLTELRGELNKCVDSLHHDLTSIRTGRASTGLVEKVRVEYYGAVVPLQQLALIATPESQTITINPYDARAIKDIERAILQSDLGLNPSNDGKIIRLPIPTLTQERRQKLVKGMHDRLEQSRISVRNHRRDSLKDLEEMKKEKVIPENDFYHGKEEVQKMTDEYIKKVDQMGSAKEAEIMAV